MKVEGNKLWERRMERAFGWGREGGSVGEEDGGRRQHSPFLFLQIKLQTYEKYWSWSVAEVSPHPAAGVQTGPVYRLSVTSSHFKAFCPSQSSSSELPESPCCRSYRRRMSLIYRLNFTPQDVHHMLSFAGLWAVGILFTPAVTTKKWLKDFRCLLTGSHVQSKLLIPKQFHMICFVCSTQYCFYCRYTNHFCNDVGPLWASESVLNFYYKHKKVLFLLTLIWFSCFSTLQRTALCESVIWSMNHLWQSISESWYVSSHFQCFHSTKSLSLKL